MSITSSVHPSSILSIKRLAKSLRRELSIPYMQALDLSARRGGYQNYRHALSVASPHASPDDVVTVLDIPKVRKFQHVYHRVVIEDVEFRGIYSADGPYIQSGASGVALGSCIGMFPLHGDEQLGDSIESDGRYESDWWICKYSRAEPRISVDMLSHAGRRALSSEFGIPFGREFANRGFSDEVFSSTRSFMSLCEWASHHPVLLRQGRERQSYVAWVDPVVRYLSEHSAPGPAA